MGGNPILTYETMRKVALEIVQLGRDVPEEMWFGDAENYATSLIRRIAEEAYEEGRKAAASDTAAKRASKSLDGKPNLIKSDIFLRPDAYTLESLRTAVEQGLEPSALDFAGDGIAVLRFTRATTKPDPA